jgi:hypothetical protein
MHYAAFDSLERGYDFRLHPSGGGVLSALVAWQVLADEMSIRSKLRR